MSTEYVRREVIEGKLLAALDDESKVAILASEDDLRLLISALEYAPDESTYGDKRTELLQGLRQLQKEAGMDTEPFETLAAR